MSSLQPLKIAILSCAHVHAPAYAQALKSNPGAELVGVWDADSSAGSAFAAEHGTDYASDLDSLLSSGLDGVVITSENVNHRMLVEYSANAGIKAILCEKPLATNLADFNAMSLACDKNGARLATAFPCRFSPAFHQLKLAVDSGSLGKILAVRATNHGKCPFGWFVDPSKSGGGAIIDHTVHVADLLHVLLGAKVKSVYAESGNNMYHSDDWEDCGMLTITYDNGVFATLDASWSRPVKSFPTWGDVKMEVVGTNGVASMDMFRQSSIAYSESDGGAHELGWGSNLDALMVDEFLTLASGGNPSNLATLEDGGNAMRVTLAAYQSVRERNPVQMDSVSAGN
jgi:predicted dehydrogenase